MRTPLRKTLAVAHEGAERLAYAARRDMRRAVHPVVGDDVTAPIATRAPRTLKVASRPQPAGEAVHVVMI